MITTMATNYVVLRRRGFKASIRTGRDLIFKVTGEDTVVRLIIYCPSRTHGGPRSMCITPGRDHPRIEGSLQSSHRRRTFYCDPAVLLSAFEYHCLPELTDEQGKLS